MTRKPKPAPTPVVMQETVTVKEEPLGFLQSYKKITVFQVIALLAITLPWITGAWKSTAWLIKPAIAGAVTDILKEDGIDLRAQALKLEEINKTVEESQKNDQKQNQLLEQLIKKLEQNGAVPQ